MRKIKVYLKRLIKKAVHIIRIMKLFLSPIINYITDKDYRTRSNYSFYYDNLKINNRIILYESNQGKICGDLYAIYRYLLESVEFKSYKHVWVVNDLSNPSIEKIPKNSNTFFVKIHSNRYLRYLARSKYLINDMGFGSYFQKKRKQIYINTWQGQPLKLLGMDEDLIKNIQRNVLHTDFLVCSDKFTCEKTLVELDINGIFNGYVLEVGSSGIDSLVNTDPNISKEKYEDKYNQDVYLFNDKDDKKAIERLINIIFRGKQSKNCYKVNNEKTKILMYCGGFYNNGITVSAINLSRYLDYNKFDLTIIDFGHKGKENIENIKRLDSRARILYRQGSFNIRINEEYRDYLVRRRGLYSKWIKKIAPQDLYKKELNRIIGKSNFDVVVDFGGYNPFWTLLFAFSKIKRKAVFLHSDMHEEYNKKIDGIYRHRDRLRLMFSLYKYFDRIVSVAESANKTNYNNLKHLIEDASSKMVYVNNVVDYQGILNFKDAQNEFKYNNGSYLVTDEHKEFGSLQMDAVMFPNKENVNFVNMGRLSPEKDQIKLLYAFNEIVKLYPNRSMKLYIIGSGPLEQELKSTVVNLNLINKVIFTGHLANPFALIHHCDCLVFSSNYEGQGLVILESLILNKPVIATDVVGVRSILENGHGLLVDNSIEGLLYGLKKYLNEGLTNKPFDYHVYNNEALGMYIQKVFK